jgi:hypothetical protein
MGRSFLLFAIACAASAFASAYTLSPWNRHATAYTLAVASGGGICLVQPTFFCTRSTSVTVLWTAASRSLTYEPTTQASVPSGDTAMLLISDDAARSSSGILPDRTSGSDCAQPDAHTSRTQQRVFHKNL